MDPNDAPPSPEEVAEARRLAQALDGHSPLRDAPQDALEVAALVRCAREEELGVERANALLARIWDEAAPQEPSLLQRLQRWMAPLGVAALAGGATAALVVALLGGEPAPTPMPPPPRSLLAAQLQTAAGRGAQADTLRAEMRSYRSSLQRALARRYGEGR